MLLTEDGKTKFLILEFINALSPILIRVLGKTTSDNSLVLKEVGPKFLGISVTPGSNTSEVT
ncbi:Uncharacterised protein [Chlamydia abortus]|nr:Uncharacterised protein [Chlamydia abortus]